MRWCLDVLATPRCFWLVTFHTRSKQTSPTVLCFSSAVITLLKFPHKNIYRFMVTHLVPPMPSPQSWWKDASMLPSWRRWIWHAALLNSGDSPAEEREEGGNIKWESHFGLSGYWLWKHFMSLVALMCLESTHSVSEGGKSSHATKYCSIPWCLWESRRSLTSKC